MSATSSSGRPPAADCNLLWALSGNVCAAPDCSVELTDRTTSRAVTLGEIAHIHASNEGGPRFDVGLTKAQRDSYANTLLLCRHHHRLVDANPEDFPADILRDWKEAHERAHGSQTLMQAQEHSLLRPPALPAVYAYRPALVEEIRQRLSAGTLALVGLSGAGKTLLAAEVLEQAVEYRYRFWLRGRGQKTLETDLASVGTYLGIAPLDLPSGEAASLVLNHLNSADDLLLVVDDASDIDEPTIQRLGEVGNVIVTSQMVSPTPGLSVLEVPRLSGAETDEILKSSPQLEVANPEERDLIGRLCDYLPLVVAQFASFSAATGMSAEHQLTLMGMRRGELLDRGEVRHATFAAALRMVWDRLSPPTRELAGSLAQLADATVPVSIDAFDPSNPIEALSRPLAFEDAIAELRRYSLVDRWDGLMRMHSLVRDVVITHLSSNSYRELMGATQYVSELVPYWSGRADTWATMDALEPHLEWLISHTGELDPLLTGYLANKLGPYLESRGRLTEARAVLDDALNQIEDGTEDLV